MAVPKANCTNSIRKLLLGESRQLWQYPLPATIIVLANKANKDFPPRELCHKVSGRKDLAIEPSLLKPLDKIASMSLLQKHGVAKVYHFNGTSQKLPWGEHSDRRVYLVKPTMVNAKCIANQVGEEKEKWFTVSSSHCNNLTYNCSCPLVTISHSINIYIYI